MVRQKARGKRQEARGKRQEARGKRQEARWGRKIAPLSSLHFFEELRALKPDGTRLLAFFSKPYFTSLILEIVINKIWQVECLSTQ
ncbi:hypothetical protein [Dactylococcopsis salina]|uniref:hypothetical protein n=1 Tax=Dactylococcopsis salina TaxID=292566 RepID=UPI0002DA02D8|nr:hypothetical protein [Dactylococcopsis salina]